MRVKKASINVLVNMAAVILGFLPAFIVRKSFLDSLGTEALGLVSLFANLIGLLSLAELGIGSAIIFSLYKPFAEGNREKMKGYLVYYSRFYKTVGAVVFGAGLLFAPFLHLLTKNAVDPADARLYFILFLTDTLISYLFSYKLCMLVVAQEGYKVSIAAAVSKLAVSGLQLAMFESYPSFTLYICIQIAVNLAYYLCMSAYIDKRYPWLKQTKGSIAGEEKAALLANVKALFMHKIGGTLVFGVDNIVISAFVHLSVVGIFNSYYMVIGAMQTILSNALSGVTASIGNLLTEGNAAYAYQVHKRLFFISFWAVSFVTISLFNTLQQFVRLWLGAGHSLDLLTMSIVLINFYFLLMRGSVERFKEGAGIYVQDRYAPFAEAALNLGSSLLLVNLIGLPGVFLGTLISNVCILFWLKPKLVYNIVFGKRLLDYFKLYLHYVLIGLLPLGLTTLATAPLKSIDGVAAFAANCVLNIVIINGAYVVLFRRNEQFRYFVGLGAALLQKRSEGKQKRMLGV